MIDSTLRSRCEELIREWELGASYGERLSKEVSRDSGSYFLGASDARKECARGLAELLASDEEEGDVLTLEYVGKGLGEYRIVDSLEKEPS